MFSAKFSTSRRKMEGKKKENECKEMKKLSMLNYICPFVDGLILPN